MRINGRPSFGREVRALCHVSLALCLAIIFNPLLAKGVKDSLLKEPVPIKIVNPVYPFEFNRTKVETTVELLVEINEKGDVEEASVLSALHVSFGNAALGAVRRWKFKPAMKDGQPITVRRVVPVFFSYTGRKHPAKSVNLSRISKSRKNRNLVYPEILDQQEPVFPFALLSQGIDGNATANFVVGEGGFVVSVEIEDQSHPEFGHAAAAALMHWKFKPGEKDGQIVPFSLQQKFSFSRSYLEPTIRNWIRQIKKSKVDFITKPMELDNKPRPISRKVPVFPPSLAGKTTDGKVKIRFIVDKKGKVLLPRVEEASNPLFGFAAVTAISSWKFEPPLKDGEPVNTEFVLPMTFKLESNEVP